jgi:hypothetical protein
MINSMLCSLSSREISTREEERGKEVRAGAERMDKEMDM